MIAAMHQLDDVAISTVDVDRPNVLLSVARAERFQLSTYDAAYLALAETMDALLFTAHARLLAAAGRRCIAPDGGHRVSEPPESYARTATWPDYSDLSDYLAKLRVEAQGHADAPRRS